MSVCVFMCCPFSCGFFWGLSLPLTQITWPDPGLSLVNSPRGRTGLITRRTGLITQRTGLITQRTGLITRRTSLITRIETILLHAWSPSYYMRGALKTGGGSRASITHAWSRRVDAWTGQPTHFLLLFFFKDKSCKLSKIVSVLRSASVGRFDVSRMRDFFLVL